MSDAAAGAAIRVVFVTATHPWGQLEDFFDPELDHLADCCDALLVPVWPRRPPPRSRRALGPPAIVTHPFSVRVLATAAAEALLHPVAAAGAARSTWTGSWRTAVRNLSVLPKAMWLARQLRRRHVDHVHAYWASIPATVAMVAADLAGISWSMTAHRGDLTEDNMIPRKVTRASAVRCISQASLGLLRERAAGVAPRDRGSVVHLGVDVPELGVRSDPSGRPRLVCAAQLIPLKRHGDLLVTIRTLLDRGTDVRLDLAGVGPEEGRIRALISELDLREHVRLLGQVDHDHLLEQYRAGDVDLVVLASEVEGIPVSLMEPMAAGIPVVATDVGGVRELLGGDAGILVPVGDIDAMAKAIGGVLGDPARARQLADAGRRRIESEFDAAVTARRLAGLFGG